MADIFTKEERSRCMAAIKGKDTKPEMIVRKYLFSRGLRYRLQVKKLPGRPDIVLPKWRAAVFVDGCFWHGHEGCRFFKLPKSNIEYWERKINHNRARDISDEAVLRMMGWRVFRIWECEVRTAANRQDCLNRLYEDIVHPSRIKTYESELDLNSIAAEPETGYNENPDIDEND